ncbi:MAG: hypothetical protein ACRESS_03425 [Stenotrophobium sp.]
MNTTSAIALKPASAFFALLGLFPAHSGNAAAPAWSQLKNRDEALRALWCAGDRDPREYPFGIVIESALIRPGRTICWFESWADMNDAIKDFLVPLAYLNPCDALRLRRKLARMRNQDDRPELKVLGKLLAPELRIHWIGTFSEMRSAHGDFAQSAVSDFLQIGMMSGLPELEVPSCYLERFIIWLRQYT